MISATFSPRNIYVTCSKMLPDNIMNEAVDYATAIGRTITFHDRIETPQEVMRDGLFTKDSGDIVSQDSDSG